MKLLNDMKYEMVYEILLIYLWYNIMFEFENKIIKYSVDGGINWEIIMFVNGIYLNIGWFWWWYLWIYEEKGYVKVDKIYGINLIFVLLMFKVII